MAVAANPAATLITAATEITNNSIEDRSSRGGGSSKQNPSLHEENMNNIADCSSSSPAASPPDLCVLDVLAADATPELPHEGLEFPEALQHGLVRQESDVFDVVVRLVLCGRGTRTTRSQICARDNSWTTSPSFERVDGSNRSKFSSSSGSSGIVARHNNRLVCPRDEQTLPTKSTRSETSQSGLRQTTPATK